MSEESPHPVRLSYARIREARRLMLTMCTTPRTHHVVLLDPDQDGVLTYVSRQEAIDRKLPIYVGKLSSVDKPYQVRGAPEHFHGWGSLRYVANGATAGQIRAQKLLSQGTHQ